jgi:hypothetical protein
MSEQYFAQLNDDNIVVNVDVVTAEFMQENPNRFTGVWVETFIDSSDKTYAGIGYIYDAATDNFLIPDVLPIG